MDNHALMSVDEVAEKLGISKHRVYRRIHRGEIPASGARSGNSKFLVHPADLDEYIKNGGGADTRVIAEKAKNPMMSTSEVALATGWSVEYIRAMCYRGELPYVKGSSPRGQLRIPRAAVEDLLQ